MLVLIFIDHTEIKLTLMCQWFLFYCLMYRRCAKVYYLLYVLNTCVRKFSERINATVCVRL